MLGARILQYSIGPIGVALLSLITLPLIVWMFKEDVVASYSLLIIVINLGTMMLTFGLDQSLARNYYTYEKLSELLWTCILPGSFALILIGLAILSLDVEVSNILVGVSDVTFIIFLGVSLSFYSRYLSLIVRMQERAVLYSFFQVIPKAWLLISLLALYFWDGINREILFSLVVVGYGITFLLQLYLYSQLITSIKVFEVKKDKLARLCEYGIPLLISSCAYYLLTIADRFFIKEMLSLEDVAIYSVAVHFSSVVLIISSVFSAIWSPYIFKLYDRLGGDKLAAQTIENVFIIAAILVFILWVAVGIISYLIPLFLPHSYNLVGVLLPILIAIPLLNILSEVSGVGINLVKKTRYHSIITLVTLLVNCLANWFFIRTYGLEGAAYATLLAYLLLFVLKTEVSMWLGFSVERFGVYAVLFVLSFVSILMSKLQFDAITILYFWVLLLAILTILLAFNYRALVNRIKALNKDFKNA